MEDPVLEEEEVVAPAWHFPVEVLTWNPSLHFRHLVSVMQRVQPSRGHCLQFLDRRSRYYPVGQRDTHILLLGKFLFSIS